jgi:hypothetical protein
MNFKVLQRIFLVAVVVGVSAAVAEAQVTAHVTLPRLDVHVMAGRPPAPRYEVRGPRPGEGYIWVGGFWTAEGGRWEWVPGHWDQPPEPDVYWIQPRYVHSYGEYIYEPGHWSNQALNVGEDVRGHRSWQRHEREHEREMEREHSGYYHHDRDRDHEQ